MILSVHVSTESVSPAGCPEIIGPVGGVKVRMRKKTLLHTKPLNAGPFCSRIRIFYLAHSLSLLYASPDLLPCCFLAVCLHLL